MARRAGRVPGRRAPRSVLERPLHDFLVAFSCKGRGACPSCNAKRMAETAAHLVDQVIPHVPVRRWVLSVPKRPRPLLHHRHRTASAVLHILVRALRAPLREAGPTVPASASVGAVSFLHGRGPSLNPHFHFHLSVLDELFQQVEDDTGRDPGNPESRLHFHKATTLTSQFLENLQHTVRKRVLRHFRRQGLLEPHEAKDMLAWNHGGGFSLDANVRIEATDRAGLEQFIRYCARPPFPLERLHLVAGRSDQILYLLPGLDLAGRTAPPTRHRPSPAVQMGRSPGWDRGNLVALITRDSLDEESLSLFRLLQGSRGCT